MGEPSSERNNIRAGLARRACEVNFNRSQQQEPTESSPRKVWELVGIPVLYGEEDVKKIINQNARNGGSTAQKIRNPAEAGSKLLL